MSNLKSIEMSTGESQVSQRAVRSTEKPGDHADGALSAPMRELLLSFVDTDSNGAWNADACARSSPTTANEASKSG